jgi:hypothetical protein
MKAFRWPDRHVLHFELKAPVLSVDRVSVAEKPAKKLFADGTFPLGVRCVRLNPNLVALEACRIARRTSLLSA